MNSRGMSADITVSSSIGHDVASGRLLLVFVIVRSSGCDDSNNPVVTWMDCHWDVKQHL